MKHLELDNKDNGKMYSQYLRLNLHIADSNLTLIRKAWKMISKEGKTNKFRARRHSFFREMITTHERAKGLVPS